MANSGRVLSDTKKTSTFYLDWQVASQSVEGNYTVVNWQTGLKITGGDLWYSNAVKINSAVINGSTVQSTTKYSNIKNTGEHQLASGSTTIYHNSDGTKSFSASISGWLYSYGNTSGSGSFDLPTIPRYFSSTPKLELTSKTETSATFKWSTSENASVIQYKIDNGSWVDVETGVNKSSGTFTVNGLSANTNYTIYGDFKRADSGLWATTKPSVNMSTYAYPYCNSTPNFIIGNSLTLGLYNPLGRSVKVNIIGADGSQCTEDTTTGTSLTGYTNETCKNNFYKSIPNSNTGKYKVKVTYGSVVNTANNGNTYSTNANECSPVFSTFTYKDNNTNVTAITGNNQILVKGLSTLYVMIASANKMTTKRSATPKNYNITCDTLNKNVDYSTNNIEVLVGAIANAGNKRINVKAFDSRNNNATAYKDITVLDYNKPVINASVKRLNDFENQTTLSIRGTFTKVLINNVNKNTIKTIQYRYRETSGNWSNWTTVTFTLNDNKYSCNDVILSLDNTKSFEFEIKVTDNLDSNTSATGVGVGKPIFFISTNKKACYINGQEILMYDVVDEW